MKTFSLNTAEGQDLYSNYVWETIQSNLGYFKKFNMDKWEEAAHRTFITAVENRDPSYDDNILPYIKKLARTIMQVNQRDRPYSVQTDEGEISPIFYSLKDFIDTDNLDGAEPLVDTFKELYLIDSESFMKLKRLYDVNDISDIESKRDFRIRNTKLGEEITRLVDQYGPDFTFRVLYKFFEELPNLCAIRETGRTKEVKLRESNYTVLEKLPDTPTIVDLNGNYHFIDKHTLSMQYNPDYFKWNIVGSTMCDILKIDISPYMFYMYEEVFVDQGVNTKHIFWCGDKYKLTSPAGIDHLGLDRDKFIEIVRVELIINLMMNSIGSVIAISPDSIYIKPTRSFVYDKIRVKTQTGRIMDLPITLHIKKGSRN